MEGTPSKDQKHKWNKTILSRKMGPVTWCGYQTAKKNKKKTHTHTTLQVSQGGLPAAHKPLEGPMPELKNELHLQLERGSPTKGANMTLQTRMTGHQQSERLYMEGTLNLSLTITKNATKFQQGTSI